VYFVIGKQFFHFCLETKVEQKLKVVKKLAKNYFFTQAKQVQAFIQTPNSSMTFVQNNFTQMENMVFSF